MRGNIGFGRPPAKGICSIGWIFVEVLNNHFEVREMKTSNSLKTTKNNFIKLRRARTHATKLVLKVLTSLLLSESRSDINFQISTTPFAAFHEKAAAILGCS